jgi:hypothetical protein
MGWGAGRYGTQPAVAIKFVPKGRTSKASIVAPNTKASKGKITPASFAKKAAGYLKLGDGVKIGYTTLSGRTWMTSINRLPSSSTSSIAGQALADQFTFVGARTIRTSAGVSVRVMARKGSSMWTFQSPLETVESSSSSGSRSDGTAEYKPSSRTISQKVKEFKAGDIVAMKYDTVSFKFVLTDISPYKMTATGSMSKLGERTIRSSKHSAAFVKTAKTNLVLHIPRVNRPDGKDVLELAATLKSLTGQQATFMYYKVQGTLWLGDVTPK